MKTKIIYLSLVALGFYTSNFAGPVGPIRIDQVVVFQTKEKVLQSDSKREGVGEIDAEVFDSSSINFKLFNVSIEERIKEDQQITEYKESQAQYLSLEYSVLDRIEENNQIIDGKVSNESQPLNYKIINQLLNDRKKTTSNLLLSNDLKL